MIRYRPARSLRRVALLGASLPLLLVPLLLVPLLLVAAVVAIAFIGRLSAPAAGRVYTVAEVQAGLRGQPGAWAGRICGAAQPWPCDDAVLLSGPS